MIIDGSGGINDETGVEASLFDDVSEDAFGCWAPTDVTQTYEKDGERFGLAVLRRSSHWRR